MCKGLEALVADDIEEQNIENIQTRNGCWNCIYGGIFKILHNEIKNLNANYCMNIPHKNKYGVLKHIEQYVKDGNCAKNPKITCQMGMICNCWEYNKCGFIEKIH